MHTFVQFNDKISTLLVDADNKTKKYLQYLQTQAIEKEKFFNTIPDSIKTTSTLQYIIESLSFKLDQFLYKQTLQYAVYDVVVEPTTSIDTDIINVAYLKKNKQSELQQEYINTLESTNNELTILYNASNTRVTQLQTLLDQLQVNTR